MSVADDFEASAKHWEDLAEQALASAASGTLTEQIAQDRAQLYRRTAEAIRIEARTGVAVCTCCHRPLGGGPSFLSGLIAGRRT